MRYEVTAGVSLCDAEQYGPRVRSSDEYVAPKATINLKQGGPNCVSPAVLCLKCLQCVGTSSSCRMVARTCPSYETTCISLAYRSTAPSSDRNTVMKGCSTTDLCNQTSIIDIGDQFIYMSSTCCESNFCNINRYSTKAVYSSRLNCYSCDSTNPSLSCTSTSNTAFCDEVNNHCVDLVTTEWRNGKVSATSYAKGCGSGSTSACTDLFAYNTGRYQRYTYLQCCNIDKCNKNKVTTQVLNNKNGIYCHGCLETGNNECAEKAQESVECKGYMIRCMEAFDQNRKTVMKGCSSVAFCSSTFPTIGVPNISEIQCCAGTYCNNFTRETSSPSTVVSSSTRLNTDLRLPAFLITLIYAIIRHFP
ncbi:urokinase plasminogen activator surface receptor [Bufo gargarizans]|uniref:urokinase plasminogen activator surface receptor n=1 Tax=Bufo gargarizans TaxID=30331 RepID=UPI001CF161A2|nr:urokinase plasminogen activator surface receptor [Bufo gargarizans]